MNAQHQKSRTMDYRCHADPCAPAQGYATIVARSGRSGTP